MMSDVSVLLPLGLILLLGLAAEAIGRYTHLPRVTMLIVVGVIIGPSGLDWVSAAAERWYPLVADMALAMIGFLLGGKLTREMLKTQGRMVVWVSLVEPVVTLLIVTAGLWLLNTPIEIALLLGAIATSTDPAATNEVVREYRARGPFSSLLQGAVALDDAWGLIAFSLVLVTIQMIGGNGYQGEVLLHGLWELGGAVLVGLLLGVPMAYLTGRIRQGEPTLVEALGMVFLCAGVALWLEVSYLLAAVVMGVTVANLASHHNRPFHAIEDIEWPFMILFFILSGASLSLNALTDVGLIGGGYLFLRIVGRLCGGVVAGLPAWSDTRHCRWAGVAMLPQAGVAMAMLFTAVQVMPQYRDILLPVVVASTVAFELLGPMATRLALFRLGEASAHDR